MDDSKLFAFGVTVTFIAAAGAYVYVRECFTEEDEKNQNDTTPEAAAETERARQIA